MSRPLFRCVSGLALVAALSGAGCSSPAPVTPTPTPDPITEPVFAGNLTINGAVIHTFTTTTAGSVTVTVATLDPNPDGLLSIGVDLGTWNGTQCQIILSNANAGVGAGVIGAVTGSGTLCVRAYDVGKLTQAVAFGINIVHY
jgi:hypothetical protein